MKSNERISMTNGSMELNTFVAVTRWPRAPAGCDVEVTIHSYHRAVYLIPGARTSQAALFYARGISGQEGSRVRFGSTIKDVSWVATPSSTDHSARKRFSSRVAACRMGAVPASCCPSLDNPAQSLDVMTPATLLRSYARVDTAGSSASLTEALDTRKRSA
jgi:hypothetical protein